MTYTDEHIRWLKENYRLYGKHRITEAFNSYFGEDRSIDSLWWKIRKLGLTGDEEYRKKRCNETFGTDIGSEHITPNGYTMVKVRNVSGGRSKNWELKQRVVWEREHGKIPKGYSVIFLDNDRTNFDLSNLACVPNRRLVTLGKKDWKSSNPLLTKAALTWCELYELVSDEENYRDDTLLVG